MQFLVVEDSTVAIVALFSRSEDSSLLADKARRLFPADEV
jgi:hypothetical protein